MDRKSRRGGWLILSAVAVSLFGAMMVGGGVWALPVEIGEGEAGSAKNFVVQEGWKVTEMQCRVEEPTMHVTLTGVRADGGECRGVVEYDLSHGSGSSDCAGKKEAIKDKLRNAGAYLGAGYVMLGDNGTIIEDEWIVKEVRCKVADDGVYVRLTGTRVDGKGFSRRVRYDLAQGFSPEDNCSARVQEVKQQLGDKYVGGAGDLDEKPGGDNKCSTSILPASWCGEEGIWQILQIILDIMTMGVGVLATVGLVISGIQWLTARDKDDQIVKAKSRIFNIVIGIVVWALMWLVLKWLIPGFAV
jgi:hypothetical protein